MEKYLNETQIRHIIGVIDLPSDFRLMSQDSYNETLIAEAIKKTERETELLQATLNLAIVGFGNKNYGSFTSNSQIISIASVLKQCNVKLNNSPGALLREDELTPNRLCRFFRHYIRDYIRERNLATYMYRKYSTHEPKYAGVCFRGAEYLEDLTEEERSYLTDTVVTMDARLGTRIQDRLARVFAAKSGTQLLLTTTMPSMPSVPSTPSTPSTF